MSNFKSVLVTGASSGIGYHSIHALRESGYRVLAAARGAEDLRRLSNEGFETILLDLDDSSSIKEAVKRVEAVTNKRASAHDGGGG